MRYLPHTREDIEQMLNIIGCDTLDQLFDSIPDQLKLNTALDLPDAVTEWELNSHMEALASKNIACKAYTCMIGGGSYDHYIPCAVPYLVSRSEFSTAYTPYQPEVSQGTLQGIYEFQTMITQLTGMDIATASHYDGGTALAEAALIALNKNRKSNTIAVSSLIHPHQLDIIKTYISPLGYQMIQIPSTKSGLTDLDALNDIQEMAGVLIQSPNFLGHIEPLETFREIADNKKALFIVSFTEALAYGLLKNPASFGADIVAGEGQSLGIPKSFGGPGLGLLAATAKLMRNLPGRFVGKAKDKDGKQGFVLTLATREQHIRREKASSNICSNNGLMAMTAAVYLSCIGKSGIRQIAQINHDKAVYLRNRLIDSGFTPLYDAPFFNEFVLKAPKGFKEVRQRLIDDHCIFAGMDLAPFYPDMTDAYLFCATETVSKTDMDRLAKEVA
jgi:glycine dehydrogenase subunit 1